MKAKTVAKTIATAVSEWMASLPEHLAKTVEPHIVVTGGCIPSLFLGETVNDFDVYLTDNTTAGLLAEHYAAQFNEASGCQAQACFNKDKDCWVIDTWDVGSYSTPADTYEEGTTFAPIFLSEHAITLTDKVQIVLRFTGDAATIHENYDFEHAKCYWTRETGLVTNTRSLECILAKELVYTGSRYPLASIFRTRKFIQRGWRVHIGNYVLMAWQLNQLDLSDMDTLRDQLTGVDALYLNSLIQAVHVATANGTEITPSYMQTLIERMMGDEEETEVQE
ncbi:hypothetical protein ACPV5S_15520 [Vibrio astriarenae]